MIWGYHYFWKRPYSAQVKLDHLFPPGMKKKNRWNYHPVLKGFKICLIFSYFSPDPQRLNKKERLCRFSLSCLILKPSWVPNVYIVPKISTSWQGLGFQNLLGTSLVLHPWILWRWYVVIPNLKAPNRGSGKAPAIFTVLYPIEPVLMPQETGVLKSAVE